MADESIEKRLDKLIETVTQRNKEVQAKKESGPWGWVVGIVLALVSLAGIGVALYLANRKAKELAALKTKVEQDKVKTEQAAHDAKQEPLLTERKKLLEEAKHEEAQLIVRAAALKKAEREHAERKKRIEGLRAWAEINQ
jgi:flagellar biosynthesis/type III secretory pathway M-ring protein FliF/YscJ